VLEVWKRILSDYMGIGVRDFWWRQKSTYEELTLAQAYGDYGKSIYERPGLNKLNAEIIENLQEINST